MKYAVFADIHGNLEAYESVLRAIDKEQPSRCLCAGDIVGYGADPRRCIEITKSLDCRCVCGNHDWASVDLFDTESFSDNARAAVLWTKGILGPEDAEYLKGLELVYENGDLTLVHGTLDNPREFNYILDIDAVYKMLEMTKTSISFVGHSHKAWVYVFENGIPKRSFESEVKIEPNKKYLVNVGSVGQPRDGDWRAAFSIYDNDKETLAIRRIEYDIRKAQEKILNAGLPEVLAYRLEEGR